jgi:hypothetical protein
VLLPLQQHRHDGVLAVQHEARLHDPGVEQLDDDRHPRRQLDQRRLRPARIAAEIRRQVGFEATGRDGNGTPPIKPLGAEPSDHLAPAGDPCVCGRPSLCPAPTDSVDADITASGPVIGRVQMWTLRVHFVPADARPCPLHREKP